jgi:hypothetical protein
LHGLDVGDRFPNVRNGDLMLLARVTIDRLLVGRLGLIPGALGLVQGVGRLVELRLRSIAALDQLTLTVIGFLGQDHACHRPL